MLAGKSQMGRIRYISVLFDRTDTLYRIAIVVRL